jgi:pimeloyl-ACP methyl ester carboxylesterase
VQKHSSLIWTLAWLPFLLEGGCAAPRQQVVLRPAPIPPKGIVFAVDGAGGFHATSDTMRVEVERAGMPLLVEAVNWSHGYGRFVADQTDCRHAQEQGRHLALRIVDVRRQWPKGRIYLVGHSAGSSVLLAAAEALPPDSVDRIILLAPSVSADYDLRPALRSARYGIDNYFSSMDFGYLGLGVALVGTADRSWRSPAAGRTGFHVLADTPEDAALYTRLRQHPWDPSLVWTGNNGGHYDGYQPEYLRRFVLPLLAEP